MALASLAKYLTLKLLQAIASLYKYSKSINLKLFKTSNMKKACQLFAFLIALLYEHDIIAQTVPQHDHVVIVIMENHAYASIIGSSNAPYINSLANDSLGANFTQSYGLTHPSQPNYIMLFSGSNQGVTSNDNPASVPFNTANLGASLIAASYTFNGYSEDLPSVGFKGTSWGDYHRKHNPWVHWQNSAANGIPSISNQPLRNFPTDFNSLPTLSFVVPNQTHNMHNPPDKTIAIVNGDNWLHHNLNAYIKWAKTHNSLFILTLMKMMGNIPTVL